MYASLLGVSAVSFLIAISSAFVLPSTTSGPSTVAPTDTQLHIHLDLHSKIDEQQFMACLGGAYSSDDIEKCRAASTTEPNEHDLHDILEKSLTLFREGSPTSLSSRCARKARALGWSRWGSEMAGCMAMD